MLHTWLRTAYANGWDRIIMWSSSARISALEAQIAQLVALVSASVPQAPAPEQVAPKAKAPRMSDFVTIEEFKKAKNAYLNALPKHKKATPTQAQAPSTFVSKTQKAHAMWAIAHLRCGEKSGISPIPTEKGTYTFSGMGWICAIDARWAKTPRQGTFEYAGHKYSYTCPGVAGQLSTLTVA